MGSNWSLRGRMTLFVALTCALPLLLASPGIANHPRIRGLEALEAGAGSTAYPESAEGLKRLLEDWLAATKEGDSAKNAQLLEGFAIPNHAAWFSKTFGPAEGPRLEAAYTALRATDPDWLAASGVRSVKAERLVVQVRTFAVPADTQIALLKAALTAEEQAAPIYYVRTLQTSSDTASNFLGCFVDIDGGFRHIDIRVLQALSTAPEKPASITVGGNVQAARLIKRVQPEYPEKARKLMAEGVVRLHAIIGQDGAVRELRVIDGQPLLNQAALDAVKQWRYQPTMLLGKPVEVDTEIDVVFQLRR